MEIPDVPANNDPEFTNALSALVRSASVMRQLVLMMAGAKIDPERLMRDHAEVVMNADKVIDAWRNHLGITD